MKNTKLFCFPYAGGSSAIYEKWRKKLDPSIELIPIEYAGRGKRFSIFPYESINEMVEDASQYIQKYLDETTNYSFFGHSMGALIAYELSHKLNKLKYATPLHIFFSGKIPPHITNNYKLIHALGDDEFKKELFKLGGTPIEVLENEILMNIYLPILRSDFKAVEKYVYHEKISKLNCNLTILYSKDDILTLNKLEEWQQHTKKKCTFLEFSGGHFFISKHSDEIIKLINNTLIY